MPGPKPKPHNLRSVEGFPGHHKPEESTEPQPRRVLPKCPAWLDEDSRAEWDSLAQMFFNLGVLTEMDAEPFTVLCRSLALWKRYQRELIEIERLDKQPFYTTKSGYAQQLPIVSMANAAFKQVTTMFAEFGMGPAARTRLSVDKPVDSEDFFGY